MKLNLQSAVASLESLDSHLLPRLLLLLHPKGAAAAAVGGWPTPFSGLLAQHWSEETAKLSCNLHKIIDTKTFSACLLDCISEQLNRTEAETKKEKKSSPTTVVALEGILKMCLLFQQHLSVNDDDGGIGPHCHRRTDLRMMLSECRAVLRYADQVEMSWTRIFKRFRLLLHVLEQIRREWPDEEEGEGGITFDESPSGREEKSSELNSVHSDSDEATEYFMSFGISAAPTTSRLLYQRRKEKKTKGNWECGSGVANQSVSMMPQLPLSRLNSGSRHRGGGLFRGHQSNGESVVEKEEEEEEVTLNLNVTGESGSGFSSEGVEF